MFYLRPFVESLVFCSGYFSFATLRSCPADPLVIGNYIPAAISRVAVCLIFFAAPGAWTGYLSTSMLLFQSRGTLAVVLATGVGPFWNHSHSASILTQAPTRRKARSRLHASTSLQLYHDLKQRNRKPSSHSRRQYGQAPETT